MPYRTPGQAAHYFEAPQPLTLCQKFQVLCKDQKELSEHRWFRQHLGGLWSKAAHGIWRGHFDCRPQLVQTISHLGKMASFSVAIPAIGCSSYETYWVQSPAGVTECIHEDLRGWLAATQSEFAENYGLFADMSMVYQRLNSSDLPTICDCEKYHHRKEKLSY